MKILYVGLLYNYGKKEEGFSYEHMNIEAGFRGAASKLGFKDSYYYPDFEQEENENTWNVDAIFHVAFNDTLDLPESIAKHALKKGIPVIQWDCDSSWRFKDWILPRKDRVSHFITTHSSSVGWYTANGMKVIKSQWAGSPLYQKEDLPKIYDVSFIGQRHGIRPEIIISLIAAGIKVDLFGNYWDQYPDWHGYLVDHKDVIRVINQSKICLNMSNPWHIDTLEQIKGRHFELPQCGAFQISTPADDLENYFVPDKEIVIARSIEGLKNRIKYYLEQEDERKQIAHAGEARMKQDHQWHHRFEHIFKEIGIL